MDGKYEAAYKDGLKDGLEKAAASPWWHYPEYKPEKNGNYLVVIEFDDGYRCCDWGFYGPEGHWTSGTLGKIIYWARVKFPKRKEGEKDESK